MATRRSTSPHKPAPGPEKPPPQRAVPPASENVASRAFQSLILVLGVMLLFAFFFGLAWGTAVAGLLVFVSAFPPLRRHVDRWLVGSSQGTEADQSAVIRMAVGAAIIVIALIALLG